MVAWPLPSAGAGGQRRRIRVGSTSLCERDPLADGGCSRAPCARRLAGLTSFSGLFLSVPLEAVCRSRGFYLEKVFVLSMEKN